MSAHSLTLMYVSPDVDVQDGYWSRLVQVGDVDDIATVSDAAAAIDALYQLDACDGSTLSTQTDTTVDTDVGADIAALADPITNVTEAELLAVVVEMDRSVCRIAPDGSFDTDIKVIRSHPALPYKLRVTGGSEVGPPVRVQEEILATKIVEEVDRLVLDYPVVGTGTFQWDATTAGPEIRRNGNTLYWRGEHTGIINCVYQTIYDLATVTVAGVNNKPGEATVRCFFHGLVEELATEVPELTAAEQRFCSGSRWTYRFNPNRDRVTCYKDVTYQKVCSCSGDDAPGPDSTVRVEEVVACPEYAPDTCPNHSKECMHLLGSEVVHTYVNCVGGDELDIWLSSPAFYEQKCCVPPSTPLPNCQKRTSIYKGGKPINGGEEYWRRFYGGDHPEEVRFKAATPLGGICGEWVVRQELPSNDCCDGIAQIVIIDTPDVLVVGQSMSIFITGGSPPFIFTTSNVGTFFDGGARQKEMWSREARLYSTAAFCSFAEISITDGCSTAAKGIRSSNGQWVLQEDLGCASVSLAQGSLVESGDLASGSVVVTALSGGMKAVEEQEWRNSYYNYNDGGPHYVKGLCPIDDTYLDQGCGSGLFDLLCTKSTHFTCGAEMVSWAAAHGTCLPAHSAFAANNLPVDPTYGRVFLDGYIGGGSGNAGCTLVAFPDLTQNCPVPFKMFRWASVRGLSIYRWEC